MSWTREQLQDMKLVDLKPLASEMRIKKFSSMRKAELIDALLKADGGEGVPSDAYAPEEPHSSPAETRHQQAVRDECENPNLEVHYIKDDVSPMGAEAVAAAAAPPAMEASDNYNSFRSNERGAERGNQNAPGGYARAEGAQETAYYPHGNEGRTQQARQVSARANVSIGEMNNYPHPSQQSNSNSQRGSGYARQDERRAANEASFSRRQDNRYSGPSDRRGGYSSGFSNGGGNGFGGSHTYVNNHDYNHNYGHSHAYVPHQSHNRFNPEKEMTPATPDTRRVQRYSKIKDSVADARQVTGPLEIKPEGFGLVEIQGAEEPFDQIYVSSSQIQKFRLKTGDQIGGKVRAPKAGEKYAAMLFLEMVNGTETTKIIQEMDELMKAKPRETESRFQESHTGVLMVNQEGYGFLRVKNYMPGEGDIYVAANQIRRYGLRTGDKVTGKIRKSGENDRNDALLYIEKVNGELPELIAHRPRFEKLVPIFPNERLTLETSSETMSTRMIDLFAPLGKGQRGMIVAPPKAGKTTLLKEIAMGIRENHPEVELIILLVDERPEEVTDMQRSIDADIVYSTFDQPPQNHLSVAEMVLERSKRLVEQGKDVVVLVDSLTRLTRANNLCVNPSGRTLSGGMDPEALYFPKKLFGSARNIENGASLTIIATALIETGSRMDDIVFEEFKGTGNMEINLERELAQRRIFPAINLQKSGTRREDLLLTPQEQKGAFAVRKMYDSSPLQMTDKVINAFSKTKSNRDFLAVLEQSGQ